MTPLLQKKPWRDPFIATNILVDSKNKGDSLTKLMIKVILSLNFEQEILTNGVKGF